VLAVGDAAFQAKCIQRIKDLESSGTTIVFISHDLSAVERLCERVILMQRGEIGAEGAARDVIKQYHDSAAGAGAGEGPGASAQRAWEDTASAPGNDVVRVRSVRVRSTEGGTVARVDIRRPVGIEVAYDVLEPGHVLVPNYHFLNHEGVHLFAAQDVTSEWRRRPRPVGRYVSTAWVPGNFLAAGRHSVDVAISSHVPLSIQHAHAPHAVTFDVLDHLHGDAVRGDFLGDFPGLVRPMLEWTTHHEVDELSGTQSGAMSVA
jgi:lipopolysaccharide transport system ATP-binding protein